MRKYFHFTLPCVKEKKKFKLERVWMKRKRGGRRIKKKSETETDFSFSLSLFLLLLSEFSLSWSVEAELLFVFPTETREVKREKTK